MRYDSITTVESVSPTTIQQLFASGKVPVDQVLQQTEKVYPHTKLIIKSNSSSALGIVDNTGDVIKLVREQDAWKIKPKNKEQSFLMHTLLDTNIPLQIVLGSAGTGKTLVTYACAMKLLTEGHAFKNLVLTKPTYEVGGGPGLGPVPGDLNDKFAPFLINFEHIASELGLPQFFQFREKVSYVPIQRMRGASFINTLVIADEVQSLDLHEMRTLCTRIGKGSKLILLGDLNQIDRKIRSDSTGLHKLATSDRVRQSSLVAVSELIKNERSELSALLDEVLGGV